MYKVLVILSLFALSCSSNSSRKEVSPDGGHESHNTVQIKSSGALRLNNGSKWKTDEATRKNVAELVKIVNDRNNWGEANKAQLTKHLQNRIDTLVQECKMKGPDHDALHVWLEQVLHDLKAKNDEKYQGWHSALKRDIEDFYNYFD